MGEPLSTPSCQPSNNDCKYLESVNRPFKSLPLYVHSTVSTRDVSASGTMVSVDLIELSHLLSGSARHGAKSAVQDPTSPAASTAPTPLQKILQFADRVFRQLFGQY